MTKNIGLLLLFFLCYCNNDSKEIIDKEIVVSTEKEKLKQLIALEQFNPISVQFSYRTAVPSDNTDRLPGPTDYVLEAVLYFDNINNVHRNACSPVKQAQCSRDYFDFTWMDYEIKKALMLTKSETKGYEATCFYKGGLLHGSYYYLKDMILVRLFTN